MISGDVTKLPLKINTTKEGLIKKEMDILDQIWDELEIVFPYREAFYLGRRQEQDYTITPNQIEKKSSRAHIGNIDIAEDVVNRKVKENQVKLWIRYYSRNCCSRIYRNFVRCTSYSS